MSRVKRKALTEQQEQRGDRRSSVHLEVGRRAAVLPAAQALDDGGAAERTGSLPVEPGTQALLTEHVLQGNTGAVGIFSREAGAERGGFRGYLTQQGDGLSELSLTDGTHVPGLAALLAAGPHSVALR